MRKKTLIYFHAVIFFRARGRLLPKCLFCVSRGCLGVLGLFFTTRALSFPDQSFIFRAGGMTFFLQLFLFRLLSFCRITFYFVCARVVSGLTRTKIADLIKSGDRFISYAIYRRCSSDLPHSRFVNDGDIYKSLRMSFSP